MAGRSWIQRWLRRVSGVQQAERNQDGTVTVPGSGPPKGPSIGSSVLKSALKDADYTDEVQKVLAGYRAVLKTLEAGNSGRYRAGALESAQRALEKIKIPDSLGVSVAILKDLFQDCIDVVLRGLLVGGKRSALLIFIDGMVDDHRIELSVLEPLVRWGDPGNVPGEHPDLLTWLQAVGVTISGSETADTIGQVVDSVLGGDTVLLIDGVSNGVKLSSRGWKQRSVEEPSSESTIRGPREGFVESLRTNTMLLRRKVKSPQLKIDRIVLGRRTRTLVDVVYLKDVADPGIVAEVEKRLKRIDVDGVIDTGMLEEFIEDEPASIFPQVINTERPDRVAAALLEGQVTIMADGTPFVLIVPVTFWMFFQAGEDYYERFWLANALRWIRYVFLLLSLIGPSLYIAIENFHQEMLPTTLLLSMAAAREGIPFPALVEVLAMEVFFEALREAGVRLPRPVGQAVSIVGALVLGQSAVQAGFVSAPVVIIVAATGIASFTIPRFSLGIGMRLLRFPMMILAGTLGLFGIMVGLIAILIHLCALRSFGVPYLQPVAPLTLRGLKDTLWRAPHWLMDRRPAGVSALNPHSQAKTLKPGPGGDTR